MDDYSLFWFIAGGVIAWTLGGLLFWERLGAMRHRMQKEMRTIFDNGYRRGLEAGEEKALDEIANSEVNPYRQAARVIRGRCPTCNRGCIHCARVAKRDGLDA